VPLEVKNEGGEVGGFPAYVGDGPSDDFVNQQPPVHRPDSGHGAEQGIGHGQGDPLRLFRIEDGHEELQHPPLPRVPAIRGVEAFLRIYLPSELSGEQTILLACPSFYDSSLKSVNSSPCVRSPIIRIPPLRAYPLIPPFKLKLSQHIVLLDVPGLAEQALTTHDPKIHP
jgi:hypothetical protein